VVLTIGNGKAQLYINGQSVAQADALLPQAAAVPLVLGEGYKGLIDEVQLLPVARDAGWVKLAAAAQGMDASFVKTLKEGEGAAAEGEGGGGYMGILVKNLTVDAWVVIVILLVMFVIAAAVMVSKAQLVSRIGRANDRFLDRFRADLSGQAVVKDAAEYAHSTLYRLYATGEAEIAKRRAQGVQTLSGASLDAIKATLDAVQVRENHTLNARMVLLTIAISGGPFLGLLGTVVGVMITFAAIAAAGDVNVNAIAPGIAAALLATVAGLAVAIPALFGYNWLASRIKTISADMQIFVDEFVTRAAELHGRT
jgi:biopolymer transport protein ExbB